MLYSHGWRKLLKFFGDDPITFADPIGLGAITSLILTVFAEFFCSILLMLGFGTLAKKVFGSSNDRKVKAAQYVATHDGEVCPAAWEAGEETLAPSLDLVGKI